MNELKKCPFCGCSNTYLALDSGNVNTFAYCDTCYARSPAFCDSDLSIEHWNSVTPNAKIQELIDIYSENTSNGDFQLEEERIYRSVIDDLKELLGVK